MESACAVMGQYDTLLVITWRLSTSESSAVEFFMPNCHRLASFICESTKYYRRKLSGTALGLRVAYSVLFPFIFLIHFRCGYSDVFLTPRKGPATSQRRPHPTPCALTEDCGEVFVGALRGAGNTGRTAAIREGDFWRLVRVLWRVDCRNKGAHRHHSLSL